MVWIHLFVKFLIGSLSFLTNPKLIDTQNSSIFDALQTLFQKKMSWSIYVAPYNPVFVANNYMQDTHVPKPAFTHVCVCLCLCLCVWVGMGRSQKRSKTCIYIILYNLI
jgi:hypothetical protein